MSALRWHQPFKQCVRQPVFSSGRHRSLVPDSGFFLHSTVLQTIGIGL
jgi:hypothetical protein